MCGIVGLVTAYTNGPTAQELNVFRDMLVFDSVRGFDSTGVFGVTSQGNVHIVKGAMTGAQFVTTNEYKTWLWEQRCAGQALVGHNRWATRGTVNDVNAHPFYKDDKIILMQNGTFNGGHHHIATTDVDSEAIAHLLAREDNIETALQQVDAAYALVWYNTETRSLYLIRNDERPLYIAFTDDGAMLFASEAAFISAACERNSVKLTEAPYSLCENNLVKITFHDDTWECENISGDFKFRGTHKSWFQKYYTYPGQDDTYTPPTATNVVEFKSQPDASLLHTAEIIPDIVPTGDFLMTAEEAAKESEICSNRAVTEPALIQLLDYMPGNKNPDCTCFWVYGCKVGATKHSPSPIFYRILNKTREADVMTMVFTQEYFWATTASPVRHKVDKQGVNDMFALATYVTSLEKANENLSQATH